MPAILRHLVEFVLFGFVLAAATGLGLALCRLLGLRRVSLWELLPYALGLGLGAIGYGVLAIGLFGALYRETVVLLLAVSFGVGVVAVRRSSAERLPLNKASEDDSNRRENQWSAELGLIAICGVIALITFIATFAPPIQTLTEFDSLSYHLAAPKMFIQEHRINYIPFMHHSNFPFTIEMLYTLGLILWEPMSAGQAKLFHWMYFMGCVGVAALVAADLGNECQRVIEQRRVRLPLPLFPRRAAAVAGAAAVCATPVVVAQSYTANVDVALAFYVLLSLHALLRWQQTGERNRLLLLGVCVGLAMGVKYSGVLIAILAGAVVTWALWRKWDPVRGQWWSFAAAAALAFLIAAPWYVKNIVNTGNPVFPFFHRVFDSTKWNEQLASQYHVSQRAFGVPLDKKHWRDLLSLPWHVTVQGSHARSDEFEVQNSKGSFQLRSGPVKAGSERVFIKDTLQQLERDTHYTIDYTKRLIAFAQPIPRGSLILVAYDLEHYKFDDAPTPNSGAGFAFLLLVPTLLAVRPIPRGVRIVLVISGLWFVAWSMQMQHMRYLVPCLGIASAGAGYAYAHWRWRSSYTGLTAWLALMLALVHSLLLCLNQTSTQQLPRVFVATGSYDEEKFLRERSPVYAVSREIKKNLGDKVKLLMYGEPLGFYLDCEYMWGDPGHQTLITYGDNKTLEELLADYDGLGITHLLINNHHFNWRDPNAKDTPRRLIMEGVKKGVFRLVMTERGEAAMLPSGEITEPEGVDEVFEIKRDVTD